MTSATDHEADLGEAENLLRELAVTEPDSFPFVATKRIEDVVRALVGLLQQAEQERDEAIRAYNHGTQHWVDATCHYRNLAISLGAKPETMLDKYDRELAEEGIGDDPDGWGVGETVETWQELEAAEARAERAEQERDEARKWANTMEHERNWERDVVHCELLLRATDAEARVRLLQQAEQRAAKWEATALAAEEANLASKVELAKAEAVLAIGGEALYERWQDAVARAERAEQERDEALSVREGFISPVQKVIHLQARVAQAEQEAKEAWAEYQDIGRHLNTEADRVRVLEEALREEPSKWSFETLLMIAERLLAENYGPEVFDGSSGDPGPELIVALRAAVASCRAALAATVPPEPGTPPADKTNVPGSAPAEEVSEPGRGVAGASAAPIVCGGQDVSRPLPAAGQPGSLTSPAAETCWNCGGDAGDSNFDRSLCACGAMHHHCNNCGVAFDCPLDTPAAAPPSEPPE